jgi:hypothetical protein
VREFDPSRDGTVAIRLATEVRTMLYGLIDRLKAW